ncbi:MAG: glycosyltransferase, partial [Candidatus Scalindua sp.]
MKNNNPTLSLCMIVKNEEKFLPMCLESVKDHVDEIIIVDTGSTDSTVEIAKRYNAKIYHHAWENSFSKARNHSLKYATCDWVLILDADEEVEKQDAHKLKEVIKDPVEHETTHSVNAIYLQVLDKALGGESKSIMNAERIFKNHLGFHYVGIVHNYLKRSGPTKMADIRLYHYGYNLDEEQKEKKFIRTSTLLREQIKYDPNTPIPHHYLAICYLNRKRYDECIKEALEAIRLFELKNSLFELENLENSETHVRLLAYYTVSIAFSHKDDLTNAETYALKALDYYPDYVDAYSVLSGLYFQRKEYSKCLEVTKKYLELLKTIKSNPTMVLTIPYITIKDAWMAHSRMAIIYYEQNRELEGIQALKDAVNCKGNACELYLKIAKYFVEQGNFKLAEKFLMDGLKNDPYNKDILYCISEMYEKSGFPDKALVHLKRILQKHPDEISAQYHKGLLLFKKNRFDEAINTFASVIDKDPKHVGALFSLATVYKSVGNVTRAKDTYNNILTIRPKNPEALASLGYLYMNESNFTRAKECFLDTIKLGKYLIDAHLALSKIYISLNDPEGCVTSCDELLKCLNLPRNITIDSISDLSKLYADIGITLMKQQKELLANFSFEISTLLDPDALEKNGQKENTLDV